MLRRNLSLYRKVAPRKVEKILVANRGEIACRVFRTAKQMGIRTVAVYCDAEQDGKHVQLADEAYRLGPPPAKTSYLNQFVVLDICKKCGADAVHPGYGFLSENAEFAEKVSAAGIEFIGPPSGAIVSMGSKSESKIIMSKAAVPVVPGYHGEDQTDNTLVKEAKKIGFPLLIKAVSGGGGKGMKIVREEEELLVNLHSAKREALNFFSDDRILLEKYIERPRHVECQIFADKFGNTVFFFERDCSVQRRYQKVLEEAPAPQLTAEIRKSIGDVAVKAAKAVGYVGAGTVEFIFDTDSNQFYFMEMNTRLQVEHPVTEEVILVKGQPLDLVRLQIETARGQPLGFTQEDLALNGHCIEARVFAESPRDGFLPGSGHLTFVQEPKEGTFGDVKVRVDTGFRSKDDVLVHYDPMISKLIVWGKTRDIAMTGLRRALDEYHIVGIQTNIDFLKRCCESKDFQKGGVSTQFIGRNKDALLEPFTPPTEIVALAAFAHVRHQTQSTEEAFRLWGGSITKVPLILDEEISALEVEFIEIGRYEVRGKDFSHRIQVCPALTPGQTAVHVDQSCRMEFNPVVSKDQVAICLNSGTYSFKLHPLYPSFGNLSTSVGDHSTVNSPMPGKVAKLLVADGSAVEEGQNVLVVEAMKMEHLVKAPVGGRIKFTVREGDMSTADQVLAEIEVLKK